MEKKYVELILIVAMFSVSSKVLRAQVAAAAEEKETEEVAKPEEAPKEEMVEQEAKEAKETQEAAEVAPVEEQTVEEVAKPEEAPKEEMAEQEAKEAKETKKEAEAVPAEETKTEAPAEEGEEATAQREEFTLSEEQVGLRGNWKKKKQFLIRAKNKHGEIQKLLLEINASRQPFMSGYFEIDNEIDLFLGELGVKKEKLTVLFKSIEAYLEKKKALELALLEEKVAAAETLTPEEEAEKEKIEEEQASFRKEYETFKTALTTIPSLDNELEERLKKLDEEITKAAETAEKARIFYEEIWEIKDHKLAEANFTKVNNSLKEVQIIRKWVDEEFKVNFDKSKEIVRSQIAKTKELIVALEKNGLVIKNRVERLKKIKAESEAKKGAEEAEKDTKKLADIMPWYQQLGTRTGILLDRLWSAIVYPFQELWHFIKGASVPIKEEAQPKIAAEPTPEEAKEEKAESKEKVAEEPAAQEAQPETAESTPEEAKEEKAESKEKVAEEPVAQEAQPEAVTTTE